MAGTESFRSLTIFHYHLLPGGVTDVIVLSVRAVLRYIRELEKVTIAYGRDENIETVRNKISAGLDDALFRKLSLVHIPEIDYREKTVSLPSAEGLLEMLESRFPGSDNLWMVHNYQLGKNPVFTQAMLLATEKDDRPLLLQIHDFPECSRHANLAALKEGTDRSIYPQRENIAYGVINSRDRDYLIEAGMEEENVWLLNNPVPLGETVKADTGEVKQALYETYRRDFPALREQGRLLFYPVRSIRRKNILEAGLLVKLMETEANLLVSLPGISPAEKPYSDLVEKAFREGLIPGLWGIGAHRETEILNYPNFWAASDMIISPSIQEGFGYLYLNALHWGKPLFARYLDIMEGFKEIFDPRSSHFYREVPIPLTESDRTVLKNLYNGKIKALSAYMSRKKKAALSDELSSMLSGDRVCFSYLPPRMQYDMLKKLDRDDSFKKETTLLNKESLEALDKLTDTVPENRDKEIEMVFGEKKYADTLSSLMTGLSLGCRKADDKGIQKGLEERFLSLPYLRLLYGEGI